MFAGLVEGIRSGEEFSLYQFAHLLGEVPKKPFGRMQAISVGPTSTELQHFQGGPSTTRIPHVFYAKRIGLSNAPLSIFCEDKDLLQTKGIESSDIVDNLATASLILIVEKDNIYLERNDPVINKHARSLKRLPHKLKCNETKKIKHVINSWRHFDYHLR